MTCSEKVSDISVHSLCLKARVEAVQIVKWNQGGSSGELQCKYPRDRSNIKTRLMWDVYHLPTAPYGRTVWITYSRDFALFLFSKEKIVTAVF